MTADSCRALFVTYDGLTDPLGRSQILPYLSGLSRRGHRIAILSCEKPERSDDVPAVAKLCSEAGLDWHPIAYHKRPPIFSSVYDMRAMRRAAARLHRSQPFDLIHCRSYIPAIVGLWMKRRFGTRFLFDKRGFWAEEKVEGGSWPQSNLLFRTVYRYFKRREAECLREADHVVSLTGAAKREMAGWPTLGARDEAVSVIPCCVDLDHFTLPAGAGRDEARTLLGLDPGRSVLAYLGSLGGNYLLDEMFDLFLAYRERRPGAAFLFVTRDDPAMIRRAAEARGVGADDLVVRAARREEVPAFLAAADLGVAFKQASFSALACSPTKLGEMLAVGLPVIANSGVGDVAAVLEEPGMGALVDRFDREALLAAVDSALADPRPAAEIRDHAARWFSLEDGIARYDSVYRSLCSGPRFSPPAASATATR